MQTYIGVHPIRLERVSCMRTFKQVYRYLISLYSRLLSAYASLIFVGRFSSRSTSIAGTNLCQGNNLFRDFWDDFCAP